MVTGVTDRIEGMLMEHLEAADEEDTQSGSSSKSTDRQDIEAGALAGAASPVEGTQYQPPVERPPTELSLEDDITSDWQALSRRCWAGAPARLWQETVQVCVLGPLLLVAVMGGTTNQVELCLLLLASYATARMLTLALEGLATLLLQFQPIFDPRSLAVRGSFGWPSTLLITLMISVFSAPLGLNTEEWRTLQGLSHFWPTCLWLLFAALSRPALDVVVKFHVNALTL